MNKFFELLSESTLIQATLALGLLIGILALIFMGREVPDVLVNAFLLILGYYFGTKAQQTVYKTLKK